MADADYGTAVWISPECPDGWMAAEQLAYVLDDRQWIDIAVACRGEVLRDLRPDLRAQAERILRRRLVRTRRRSRLRRRGWA